MKPRIKIISSKEMKRRFGISRGGVTVGNTIYRTARAGEFVIEHEKAHIRLGHTPATLNIYQFVRRELKADKEATRITGRKYRKKDLADIVNDASLRFGVPKTEAMAIVRKEAKSLGLI